mmetsp:Transcript_38559/g.85834  ORF Transcript_38559/g.85834 Transcript_38559/m.85834 type:complete len:290 (+) Transcript_38559:25-894(+)
MNYLQCQQTSGCEVMAHDVCARLFEINIWSTAADEDSFRTAVLAEDSQTAEEAEWQSPVDAMDPMPSPREPSDLVLELLALREQLAAAEHRIDVLQSTLHKRDTTIQDLISSLFKEGDEIMELQSSRSCSSSSTPPSPSSSPSCAACASSPPTPCTETNMPCACHRSSSGSGCSGGSCSLPGSPCSASMQGTPCADRLHGAPCPCGQDTPADITPYPESHIEPYDWAAAVREIRGDGKAPSALRIMVGIGLGVALVPALLMLQGCALSAQLAGACCRTTTLKLWSYLGC